MAGSSSCSTLSATTPPRLGKASGDKETVQEKTLSSSTAFLNKTLGLNKEIDEENLMQVAHRENMEAAMSVFLHLVQNPQKAMLAEVMVTKDPFGAQRQQTSPDKSKQALEVWPKQYGR